MKDDLLAKVTPEVNSGRHPFSRPGAFLKLFSIEVAVYLVIGVVALVKRMFN